ncbi:MAG: PfkB family carbohydrate kinase [Thiotrichales bacterium]
MTIPTPPIVVFGEVLYDQFPNGEAVPGGAPFNVAWHLQALGADPLFISRVGHDANGDALLERMRGWGMSTALMQRDPAHPTGTVRVTLRDGQPSYHILPEQAYDFVAPTAFAPPTSGALLYHGSLAARAARSAATLDTLRALPHMTIFSDINLRDPWWQRDAVLQRLRGTRYVKLNDDELARLLPQVSGLTQRLDALHQHTGCEVVILTRGAAGALLHTTDGRTTEIRPEPTSAVIDTVGAGDAFAAVTLFGLSRGWAWPKMLAAAQALASLVVTQRGAVIESIDVYRRLLATWSSER